jgi:hypothetical protein
MSTNQLVIEIGEIAYKLTRDAGVHTVRLSEVAIVWYHEEAYDPVRVYYATRDIDDDDLDYVATEVARYDDYDGVAADATFSDDYDLVEKIAMLLRSHTVLDDLAAI